MNCQTCVNQQSTDTRSEHDRNVEVETHKVTPKNAQICGKIADMKVKQKK